MARKGYIVVTHEVGAPDMDSVIVGSVDLRIHYLFTPGGPETGPSYASGGIDAPGMSLRDWFAGQAMTAIINSGADDTHANLAKDAYRFADAMLWQRREKPRS
jgi:hypothetical protein